ncbi:NAD-dependent epimerase/dehydratase family protein [Rhodococcoides kroppenstedtii]|uniref:NAD-dependent epimerase/dehydratase family protein n=1 Tax=Rhodococcoides kroppenstedtii TaxID=293050 RepID=UPI000837B1B9|nr:NAD-dependent epimerase/dehydratase family protein [Rhodococcus kroppenstedtii]
MSDDSRASAAPRVVLVTGASRFLGGYLTARLAQNPSVERVIAVDAVAPTKDMIRRMGRAEFVRADIRNPLIGKVIRSSEVDTVVHASLISRPPGGGGRTVMKDLNVLGAMQLFAVCQKSPSVRRVVLRSSTAVYGCSAKDPAQFTEEMGSKSRLRGGFARDAVETEGYARGLGRRRPDVDVTILRNAPMIGPRLNGAVSRYLTSPLTPSVLGRDARMQLLHEEDALAALERATVAGPAGTFNVAADGIVMLSQAIRRAGRIEVPVPPALFRTTGKAVMGSLMRGFSEEQLDYFNFGCGVDTTRMKTVLGFTPRWTTMQAFDDFVRGVALTPVVRREWIDAAEARLLALLGVDAARAARPAPMRSVAAGR